MPSGSSGCWATEGLLTPDEHTDYELTTSDERRKARDAWGRGLGKLSSCCARSNLMAGCASYDEMPFHPREPDGFLSMELNEW